MTHLVCQSFANCFSRRSGDNISTFTQKFQVKLVTKLLQRGKKKFTITITKLLLHMPGLLFHKRALIRSGITKGIPRAYKRGITCRINVWSFQWSYLRFFPEAARNWIWYETRVYTWLQGIRGKYGYEVCRQMKYFCTLPFMRQRQRRSYAVTKVYNFLVSEFKVKIYCLSIILKTLTMYCHKF